MKHEFRLETTSMSLHLMAMAFMLCDHLWATLIPGQDWLTCIGRLTFPIFAFLIVEGYYHTRNLKKYVLRLLLFAVLSEIPFNLVMGSSVFYPFHQNVLWTFLIGILCIYILERARKSGKVWKILLAAVGALVIASVLGLVGMVDYFHAGVYMVLVFYLFRGKKWWQMLGQFLLLYYINTEILGGRSYEFQLLGHTFSFVQQNFSLLALIPIWLYRGKQGPHNKYLQLFYYAFYPVHLLILGLIQMYR